MYGGMQKYYFMMLQMHRIEEDQNNLFQIIVYFTISLTYWLQVRSKMDDSWGWLVATTLRGDKIFCLSFSVTAGRHQDSCNVFVDEEMFHSMDHDFGGESYVR